MAKCDQCGTHLWVGSQECPACDPVPFGASRSSRPAPDGAGQAPEPVEGSQATPESPAEPRRWLALVLVVAFLPVGLAAWYSAKRVALANDQQDYPSSHAWSRRVLACAAAVPALWLVGWGIAPALVAAARRDPGAATAEHGGDERTPSFDLLSSDLEDRGLDRTQSDCIAAAVLADLDSAAWDLAASNPASPALQDRVAHLVAGC